MFTLTDKVLLDRAARLIKEQATLMLTTECPAAGWGATADSRKAKLAYDRLVRDERDMRMLGKRMCEHFGVKAERVKPAEATTPLPLEDEHNVSRETIPGKPEYPASEIGDTLVAAGEDVGF